MDYKIIVLDLDGTLTNRDKVITPRTKEALMKGTGSRKDRGAGIRAARQQAWNHWQRNWIWHVLEAIFYPTTAA